MTLAKQINEPAIALRGKLRVGVKDFYRKSDIMGKADRETQRSFPKLMLIKPLAVVAVSCLIWIASWVVTPSAIALTQIKLYDLSYHDCPPELAEGTVTSGSAVAANCFLVTGKAENSSGKPVVNADIFGRIYDADGNSVFQNRTRLGSIDEVPTGVSDFELRITVAANQPTPLELKQFKAAGFTGKVRR